MKITRKGYYTIEAPNGELLKKPDGSIRQSTNDNDCDEYIFKHWESSGQDKGTYIVHPPKREVEMPKIAAPQPEPAPQPDPDPAPEPKQLLTADDITYLGSFELPDGYRPHALGKGKDANTLYCSLWGQFDSIGVVSNPGIGESADEIKSAIDIGSAGWHGGGGSFPFSSGFYYDAANDVILYSHYAYYPTGRNQQRSVQALEPVSLKPIGQPQLITGGANPQRHMGNFGPVPAELQSELGGDTFTLGGPMSITGYTSNGISIKVFNAADVDGSRNDIPGTVLSDYTDDNEIALFGGSRFGGDGSCLAESTAIDGGAFIEGARTFMAWGAEGLGDCCYGPGSNCGDPCNPYSGNHAYPYRACVFFFDVDDLVKVANGDEPQHFPVPYNREDGLPFNCRGSSLPPFPPNEGSCGTYGYQIHTHYDPETKRIYVGDDSSTVYVFQVAA